MDTPAKRVGGRSRARVPEAVAPVDPRLTAALSVQLGAWRRTLGAGARRVGWKLGAGEAERIGEGPVIGHLTTATQLSPGGSHRAEGAVALHADAEVAVEIGPDGGIAGFGAALELVDLATVSDDAESIVAANVFHRAFALGPLGRPLPPEGVVGRLVVNGEERAAERSARDFGETVRSVAEILDAVGESLHPGDVLITGSVVQVPVGAGDEVVADLGPLGRVAARVYRASTANHPDL